MRDIYPEEAALLRRLYERHAFLSEHALSLLETNNESLPSSFLAVNKQADAVWREIRGIIGPPRSYPG
jgi:hypothetical protein